MAAFLFSILLGVHLKKALALLGVWDPYYGCTLSCERSCVELLVERAELYLQIFKWLKLDWKNTQYGKIPISVYCAVFAILRFCIVIQKSQNNSQKFLEKSPFSLLMKYKKHV